MYICSRYIYIYCIFVEAGGLVYREIKGKPPCGIPIPYGIDSGPGLDSAQNARCRNSWCASEGQVRQQPEQTTHKQITSSTGAGVNKWLWFFTDDPQ